MLDGPHIVSKVLTSKFDDHSFTVPGAKFVERDDVKRFFEKTEVEQLYIVPKKAIVNYKTDEADDKLLVKMPSVRFQTFVTNGSDVEKTSQNAFNASISLEKSDMHRNEYRFIGEETRRHQSRRHRDTSCPNAHKWATSVVSLERAVTANESHSMALDYRSYRSNQKFQKYDDNIASEVQQMGNKVYV